MIKIFFVCSGLGRINRGFESFTQECFAALKETKGFELTLFKGGGDLGDREIPLRNIPRDKWLGRWIGWLALKRGSYLIQQLSFFISLLPYLKAKRPDIILFSEGNLGNILWRWKHLRGHNYKLLFSNGGPSSPPFSRWEFVHQISSLHYQIAKAAGQPDDRQTYIPYGSEIPRSLPILDADFKAKLRKQLGLPENGQILLSVAAINASHKRLDYVVRELAAVSGLRPFLVMLGQMEAETPPILKLAEDLLGPDGYRALTVTREEVSAYYAAADLFVLGSLHEGMGKVLVEAMAHGLPCLAHDYSVSREVLGDFGHYADFAKPRNLTELLGKLSNTGTSVEERQARHFYAYNSFSWESLRQKYIDMLFHAAAIENVKKES